MFSSESQLERSVPLFDGSNFLEWSAQMTAYLMKVGCWRIVNGTTTRPLAAGIAQDDWDNKDEIAHGSLILRLAHNLRTGVVGTTAATTWTNVNMTWARTGVSSVYQDFKAAMRVRVSRGNPANYIMKLFTHLERLRANQVIIPDYVQGMMLLNVISNEWDHVAAYYAQTTQQVSTVSFAVIRTAILAEFDRSGGSRNDQTHIADKISAVKRKGKSPHFSKQQGTNRYKPALSEAGPSNSKRNRRNRANRGKKPHGDSHHHSHLASRLEMNDEAAAVQQRTAVYPSIAQPGTLVGYPSRAQPSQTVVSFSMQGITYVSKPKHSHAQTFTVTNV